MDRSSVHCLTCGGYVAKPAYARYRVWSEHTHVAPLIDQPCVCIHPVLLMPQRTNGGRRRATTKNEADG